MSKRVLQITAVVVALAVALVGVAVAAPRVSAATGGQGAAATDAAYLGVSVLTLDSRSARQLGLEQTEGVAIVEVVPGSPAEAAGLKKGDVVIAINGVAVKSADSVVAEVQKAKAGDVVTVDISRGGLALSIKVTSTSAPAKPAPAQRQPKATPPADATPRAKPTPGAKATPHATAPAELQGLLDALKGRGFDNYYGSTHTFKNADGNAVTVRIIPGTVTQISDTSITIKPNDPQANGGPYTIDEATIVAPAQRAGNANAIKVDDKVSIVVVGSANRATLISKGALPLLGGRGFSIETPSRRGNFNFNFEFQMPGNLLDRFHQRLNPGAQDSGA